MKKQDPLDDKNYLRFYELIQMRTGIRVGENRREILAHALKESLESVKCTDLDQFFSCLQDAETDSEVWNDLIKKVTIGETHFFRDSDTIEALRRHILPDLIARHHTDRTLRLWSAGCATGEEPYTLAILLRQILSDIDRWKILILATDINRRALSHAASGRYRAWSFRETDPVVQSTYFTADGGTFTLEPAVREMVTFVYHNLAEDNYPSPANQTSNLDLILCRNVTIYLPTPLIYDIANRFYQCLSNGGWLIVGPSETHLEIYRNFQTLNFHGAIAYQRLSSIPPFPSLRTVAPKQMDRSGTCLPMNSLPVTPPTRQGAQTTPTVDGMLSTSIRQSPRVAKPLAPLFRNPTDDIRIVEPPEREASRTNPEVGLYPQGEEFMKHHRYEEARACFLSCLAKEPGSITALYRMACLEANAGRLKEARKWGEEALDRDPLRSEVHYTLALVHEVQGELHEAINRLKKVIYLDPNFILAHIGLFHLYQRTGNPNEAERHRTLAVHLASKLSPDAVLPGSDDLTAGELLTMTHTVAHDPSSYEEGSHDGAKATESSTDRACKSTRRAGHP
ncbi:MAG TPA: CheR family methyltransferase [Thermodesulfobacteriota bacterium]|jgi:chemotaxis protein methyltransferase CheR|nr:CheR family methyltransferase [Thermodesulfobacteriota bacterium]